MSYPRTLPGVRGFPVSRSRLTLARLKVLTYRWERKHPYLSVYFWAIRGWRFWLMAHSVFCGVGYLTGQSKITSSPALNYIQSFPVPIQVWGIIFILAGIGLLDWHREHFRWAHLVLGLAWSFWSVCIFLTTVDGSITGWGAPAHVAVMAGLHIRLALRD